MLLDTFCQGKEAIFYVAEEHNDKRNLEKFSSNVLGGVPQYLEKFDSKKSVEQNIKETFFNKSSYFYDEPKNILKQELREPIFYNSIIEVIAKGASKMNEITTKVGESSDKCAKYIKNLCELGGTDTIAK